MSGRVAIRSGDIELVVACDFGPRVVQVGPVGGPELLADLGDAGIDLPDGRRYLFRGGHRLWVAPEVPATTYWPDAAPVAVEQTDGEITAAADGGPFGKLMTVTATRDGFAVEHRITNQTAESIEAAAWAITQFRPGGIARLPLGTTPSDPHGLQPDRNFVVWPYFEWDDSSVRISADEVVLVSGSRDRPTKFGTSLGAGELSYELDGWRFIKTVDRAAGDRHLDFEANAQIYANAQFVELETLGPLRSLAPGASTTHLERWRVEPV